MGLFDQVLGSLGGQGQSQSSGGAFGSSSTMVAALLAMLAAKAVTSGGIGNIFGGNSQNAPASTPSSGGLGGMLGNIFGGGQSGSGAGTPSSGGLGGGLGGMLGGGGIAGGLGQLIHQMQQNGHGDVANSWVSGGPSQPIQPGDLGNAIGADTLQELSRQSGLPPDEVAKQLSHALPQAVDKLTPEGRLPSHDEASQWV